MKIALDGTELLTTIEAAPYTSSKPEWLAQGRRFGFGPEFIRHGQGKGRIFYTRAALDIWLAEQKAGV